MPLFGTWLEQTADLQRSAYGHDPSQDPADGKFDDWITYVREQTLAAFVELGEFIQNLKWKPWSKVKKFPDDFEREEAVEELVDVLHFVANVLFALDVSDEELNVAYEKKMNVNRARMESGGHH